MALKESLMECSKGKSYGSKGKSYGSKGKSYGMLKMTSKPRFSTFLAEKKPRFLA